MEEKNKTQIPNVKLSTLEKIIKGVKETTEEDVEISFEFIIGSLFPTSWNNIQKALADQYTQGYIEGYNTAKEEYKIRTSLSSKDDADCYCD